MVVIIATLFVVSFVSAVLITYFGNITTTVDVERAITLGGVGCSSNVCSQSLTAFGGETAATTEYNLSSQTSVDIDVSIVSTITPTDGGVESVTAVYTLYAEGTNPREDRIRITGSDAGLTDLDSLTNISFSQNVSEGYIGHIDIRLEDKTLVFEYAKVDPTNCDNAPYPTGLQNTFGDKGIVDSDAYGWLASGVAGYCGLPEFDDNHKSLAQWKISDGTKNIVALEFEVDSWIATSKSRLKDIRVNGVLQNTIIIQSEQDVVFDNEIKFADGAEGTYTIETEVQV